MSDWRSATLGELGSLRTSSVDKLSRPREQSVRLVNYMDVYEDRAITAESPLSTVTAPRAQIQSSRVQVGDVLFTPSSETPYDIGHSAVVASLAGITLHSYHTVRFRPQGAGLDCGFSGYLGESPTARRHFRRRASGSTRYTLSQEDFKSLPIALPPIDQQVRISAVLADLDESIQLSHRLIGKLESIKEGLARDTFTGPRSSLHDGWPSRRLGDVVEIRSGSTPSRSRPDYWRGVSMPWVKTGEIRYNVIVETEEHVSDAAVSQVGLRVFPIGTILMAMYGQGATRGRVARLGVAATINQACAAIVCRRDEIDPTYLYQFLRMNYDRVRALGQGSNQTNLSAGLICELVLPVPASLEEQELLGAQLQEFDARIEIEAQHLSKLELVKRGLLSDLLSGEVRFRARGTS